MMNPTGVPTQNDTGSPGDASSAALEQALRFDNEGWLLGGDRVCSPNFDPRPDPHDVSLLVIHNISLPPGQFGTGCVSEFLLNRLDCSRHPFFEEIRGVRVSAHFLIERTGKVIQFVSTFDRAWHAGVSEFEGRSACNNFSIGIELEGVDDVPYSDAQYSQLQVLTQALMQRHSGITPQRIVGHSDIAPGRKTDPGPAFDWPRYLHPWTGGETSSLSFPSQNT